MAAQSSLRTWRTVLGVSITSALSGCAPFRPSGPTTSAIELPGLADASYVAFLEPPSAEESFGGQSGPTIVLERGRYECRSSMWREAPAPSCPPAVDAALRELPSRRSVLVMDGSDQPTVFVEPPRPPIDSAAKALVTVWFEGRYSLSFAGGEGESFGGLDTGYVRAVDGGFEVLAGERASESSCGTDDPREIVRSYRVTLLVHRDGTIEPRDRALTSQYEVADPCHPLGRRPEGFADVSSGGTLAGHLLRAMHHEAESVRAFRRLANELRAHGAPAALVRAAKRAIADERRHAWTFARLLGVTPSIASDALPVRSLADCARENAVEGCVHETYAAAVAAHQASHARSPRLRAAFARIARDELDHAAIAHAARTFFEPRLSPCERQELRRAAADAKAELSRTFRDPTSPEQVLGLPSAVAAHRLLAAACVHLPG